MIDVRLTISEAVAASIQNVGTLRVLYDADRFGLCDLKDISVKLQQTNFLASARLYKYFMKFHQQG